MGCCTSRPYRSAQASFSSHAINGSSTPPVAPRPSTAASSIPTDPSQRRTLAIRIVPWRDKQNRWTRRSIDHERAAFFDTRVTGYPHIWGAIHQGLRVIWDERWDAEADENVATVTEMLKAVDLTIPTGSLSEGLYDSHGNLYALPTWVVSDPENLRKDDDGTEDGSDRQSEEVKREEKGKGVAREQKVVWMRARLTDSQDVKVKIGVEEKAAVVRKKVIAAGALQSTQTVRLFFRGKEWKGTKSLPSLGWTENDVVTALIFG